MRQKDNILKQVLLVDSDKKFRDYLSMTLEAAFELEVNGTKRKVRLQGVPRVEKFEVEIEKELGQRQTIGVLRVPAPVVKTLGRPEHGVLTVVCGHRPIDDQFIPARPGQRCDSTQHVAI